MVSADVRGMRWLLHPRSHMWAAGRFLMLAVALSAGGTLAAEPRPVDGGAPDGGGGAASGQAALSSSSPGARARREGFVVQPFANTRRLWSLDHLGYGAAAVIAERLAVEPPLRFEGGAEPFGRTAVPSARWVVTGSFDRERDGDQRIAMTVEIRPAAAPEEVVASAVRRGSRDEAATMAVDAALAAFAETPGVAMDPGGAVLARAPFARDPYAFVIYGRAVAATISGPPATRSKRALALVTRALRIDPKLPEGWRLAGLIHLQAGRQAPARAAMAQALELRPDYVAALRSLAALDRAAGQPTARELHARLVTLDPHDLAARRGHGELLAEAGELAQAQRELETVLALAPDDLPTRRSLVLVLAARRAGKELVTALEEVVRLDPESIEARLDLAAAYLGANMSRQAGEAYDEILRRKPRHPTALKLAADLARDRGDLKLASSYYARLRTVAPADPRPVFLMAAAHADAGNLELAERLFTEGAYFPGMRGDALSNLAALALRRGEPKQALWFASRAAKLRPEKAGVRYNHALALHQLGRHAEALGEVRAAESLDPQDPSLRFFAGVISLRLGLLEEAAASFGAALALDPKLPDARHNLRLLEGMGIGGERSLSLVEAETTPAAATEKPSKQEQGAERSGSGSPVRPAVGPRRP